MKHNKAIFIYRETPNGNSHKETYIREKAKQKNVSVSTVFKSETKIIKLVRRIVLTLKLPIVSVFFGEWKKHIDEFDIFIIPVSIFSPQISKYIRARTSKKIVHWYWNPVASSSLSPDMLKSEGCDVFSFDPGDCERYGLKYASTYYFSSIILPKKTKEFDVFFIGEDKGRLEELLGLREELVSYGLKTNFHITKSKTSSESNEFSYAQRISYSEVLENISKSVAVVDILQVGQTGNSLRPMESLFHQKKLITNDLEIEKCDFYNKENIFIIGKDSMGNLREFLDRPYCAIDSQIINKYDFPGWLAQISEEN